MGATDVEVSELGFGTAPLGGLYSAVDASEAGEALSCALDNGIRYFDTAPLYGFGMAEERLGDGLAVEPKAKAVISTKVGRRLRPASEHSSASGFVGAPPIEAYFDWTFDGIRRSLESSLARLAVDHVDIVFLHDPHESEFDDVEKLAYPALLRLRDEGLVRAIGAGMNKAADAVELLRRVELDCVLIAGRVTLLDQSAATELLPLCEDQGIGVIAGGVFNSGILARPDAAAHFDYVPATRELLERAREIERVCGRHDVPLAAAALQYPFRYRSVVSVIPGMRSAQEVKANLDLFSREIPEELWGMLERTARLPAPIPRT